MDITTAPSEYLEAELVAHAASERLRVARALTVLPHVRDGLSCGKLSYSKVRELTRVATPDTDQCLAEIAGCATAAQVATMVRQLRRRTPSDVMRQVETRGLRWEVDDSDGSMVFTLRVPTEVGQAVVASIESAFVPEVGIPAHQTRADVCTQLICGNDEHRARPEVFVHLHGDTTSFEDGTAVAPEIVESLACDGPVTTVVDTEAGPVAIKKDPPPSRAQRRWLKHRLVHTLDLQLALHPDRRLEVKFPAGNPVDRNIPFAPFVAPVPDDPDLISGSWTGERLRLDYVLLAVASAESANRRRRSAAQALVA
ncbi:MAG: hypothetical protein RL219_2398 [Actinomycetota bacterium]|jgi:hypothetical protein